MSVAFRFRLDEGFSKIAADEGPALRDALPAVAPEPRRCGRGGRGAWEEGKGEARGGGLGGEKGEARISCAIVMACRGRGQLFTIITP